MNGGKEPYPTLSNNVQPYPTLSNLSTYQPINLPMLTAFFQWIEKIHAVDAPLREALLREVEEITVPKKTLLLREGQRSDWAFMVEQGLLRSYYLKDGEEVSSRFMPEGSLVVVVHSFYSRQPGYEFLET